MQGIARTSYPREPADDDDPADRPLRLDDRVPGGGEGPTIVLLHGLMDATLWDEVVGELSPEFRWRTRMKLDCRRMRYYGDRCRSRCFNRVGDRRLGLAELAAELASRRDAIDAGS